MHRTPHDAETGDVTADQRLESLLDGTLCLDLEVSHQGQIIELGAVLGERTVAWHRRGSASGLKTLADLAKAARCVLGHNLLHHDLAVLRETAADHPLLRLPVIDTRKKNAGPSMWA